MPTGQFVRKKKPSYEEAMKKRREEILKMTLVEIKIDTKYVIHFEDHGQDFLQWMIGEDGYVLDSQPFQRDVWAGKFTIPDFIKVGDLLPVWLEGESYIKYPIKKIEVRNLKEGSKNG